MTTAAILSLLAYVLPIILEAVKKWQDEKAAKEASGENNIQATRQALAKGNGDAVDARLADQHDRINRLLAPEPGRSARL